MDHDERRDAETQRFPAANAHEDAATQRFTTSTARGEAATQRLERTDGSTGHVDRGAVTQRLERTDGSAGFVDRGAATQRFERADGPDGFVDHRATTPRLERADAPGGGADRGAATRAFDFPFERGVEDDPGHEFGDTGRAVDRESATRILAFDALDTPTRVTPHRAAEHRSARSSTASPGVDEHDTGAATRILPSIDEGWDASPARAVPGDDAPTTAFAAPASGRGAQPAPAREALGAPPRRSYPELRPAHRARGRRRLGASGVIRLVVAVPILLIGMVLSWASIVPVLRTLDVSSTTWWLGGTGLALLAIAWLMVPGPIGGRIAAVLMTIASSIAVLSSLMLMTGSGGPLGSWAASLSTEATRTLLAFAAPALIMLLGAASWLAARGKPAGTIVMLLIPVAIAGVAALVLGASWLFSSVFDVRGQLLTALASTLDQLPQWMRQVADDVVQGIEISAQALVGILPVVLLALPFRGRVRGASAAPASRM